MANILNAIGVASTVGGLASNLTGRKKPSGGAHASWATQIPTHINAYGIQRDNLGLIMCPVPKVIRDRYHNPNPHLVGVTRRTEGYNVPGPAIQTTDVRRYGVGPVSRMPVGNVNTNVVTLNFVADQDGLYYQYFVAWMDSIVHFSGRRQSAIHVPNKWGNHFYEVSYHNEYAVDLSLYEMNQTYDTIIETTLVDAYPVSIQDKQMNWGNSGMVTFNIEFAYQVADTNINKLTNKGMLPPPPNANRSSLIGNLIKAGNAVQLLSSIKKSGGIKGAAGIIGAGAAILGTVGGVRR